MFFKFSVLVLAINLYLCTVLSVSSEVTGEIIICWYKCMACTFECGCMCLKVQAFEKCFKYRNLVLDAKRHLISNGKLCGFFFSANHNQDLFQHLY